MPKYGWKWLHSGLIGPLPGTFGSPHRRLAGRGKEWAQTHPLHILPPEPSRGRRPSGSRPAGPRPAARPAGPLAQARCRGRRIRAALPLARPASFLPAEPGAIRAWPLPPSPRPSSLSRPTPHPARGSCWGRVPAGRLPGRAAVVAVPRPVAPPPQPACGRRILRGVERGEPPQLPIQRPGRPRVAGATFQNRTLVAAFGSGTLLGPRRLHCFLPLFPPAPFPHAFLPSPTPSRAAGPLPPSGHPSFLSLHTCTSLYLTPRGPLLPSPLSWLHGPSRRPLMLPAASWLSPQFPERGECLAGLEGAVRVLPGGRG